MWGHKKQRIADLEARNDYLNRQLEKAREAEPSSQETTTVVRLRAELRQAKATLWETERQLGEARRENAVRTRRMVAYSNQAVANARQADRYRAAWLLARARAVRHRDDAAQQQRLADRLMEQLLDLPDRTDTARALLGLPERETAKEEVTER